MEAMELIAKYVTREQVRQSNPHITYPVLGQRLQLNPHDGATTAENWIIVGYADEQFLVVKQSEFAGLGGAGRAS